MDSFLESDTQNETGERTDSAFQASFLTKISSLDCLKPLPSVAMQLMQACQNPDGNIADLVGLIESDPAISIRILTAANSPLYGHTRLINSIQHAVVVLGFGTIAQLATSLATMAVFIDEQTSKSEIGKQRLNLFRHSLACAAVARRIFEQATDVDPEEAYLAAVLHDVGKLVFYELAPSEYSQLIVNSTKQDRIENEAQLFGISHERLGEMCAENWGLPDKIGIAIGFHHQPHRAPMYNELARVTEAANHYANAWRIGLTADDNLHTQVSDADATDPNVVEAPGDNDDSMLLRLDESVAQGYSETAQIDYEKIVTACEVN